MSVRTRRETNTEGDEQKNVPPADDPPSLTLAGSSVTDGSVTSSMSSSLTAVGCTEKFADKRTMTPFQEKINAITILPTCLFCLHYLVSTKWIRPETMELAEQQSTMSAPTSGSCFHWSLLPNLHALPPPTIVAICLGTILHCPCSFLYHWKYAAAIPNPVQRLKHWSRRLDHSAIHICSIFWAYGLSGGNLLFLILNLVYNIDSIRCHWEEEIQPRRNQLRILVSMLLYTSPLWFLGGNLLVFGKVWAYFVVAVWLFALYPFRGWSHAAFHMVMLAVPPLLLDWVADREAGGKWAMAAAQCAAEKL